MISILVKFCFVAKMFYASNDFTKVTIYNSHQEIIANGFFPCSDDVSFAEVFSMLPVPEYSILRAPPDEDDLHRDEKISKYEVNGKIELLQITIPHVQFHLKDVLPARKKIPIRSLP